MIHAFGAHCHDRTSSLPGVTVGGVGAMDGDGRQVYHHVVFPERASRGDSRRKGGDIERPAARGDHYGAAYGNFASELYAERAIS